MAVIGKIRQNVGALVFIIAIAIIGFLFMDMTSLGGRSGNPYEVGTIDGEDIDYIDFQRKYERAVSQAQRNQEMNDDTRYRIREQTWDTYVKDMLLDKEYDKLGIDVSTDEMTNLFTTQDAHAALKNDPTFKDPISNQFDPAKVIEYMQLLGSDELEGRQAELALDQWNNFERYVKNDQKKQKYLDLVKKAIYVPSWEADINSNFKNKKFDIEYVYVPNTTIADSEITMSDDELRAYLSDHEEEYKQEATVDLQILEFPVLPSDDDIANTEAEVVKLIRDFKTTNDDSSFVKYNSEDDFNPAYLTNAEFQSVMADSVFNVDLGTIIGPYKEDGFFKAVKVIDKKMVPDSVACRHILVKVNEVKNTDQAKAELDSLKSLIEGGASFATVAEANSEDPGSGSKGGDLGWAKKNQMVPPFNSAIFYEMEEGDMKMVQTRFGWHLIEVTDIATSSEGAKLGVISREITASSETSNRIFAEANTFASLHTTLQSFEDGAAEKGYQAKSANALKRNDYNLPGIGVNDNVVSWGHDNELGSVSNVFNMDDKYLIAAIVDKKSAGVPTLEEARMRLEADVRQLKKAERLISELSEFSSIDGVGQKYSQDVKVASGVNFAQTNITGLGREPRVQAAVMNMNTGDVSDPIRGVNGVYMVKVVNIEEGTEAADGTADANVNRNKVDFGLVNGLRDAVEIDDQRYKLRSSN